MSRFSAFAFALCIMSAAGQTNADVSQVSVSCATLKAVFDKTLNGALVELKSASGVDFAAPYLASRKGMFEVAVRRTDDYVKRTVVTPSQAKEFRLEKTAQGVRLVYSGFGEAPVKSVVCYVNGSMSEGRLRWRISAEPKAGWAVCEMSYPRLAYAGRIGETGEDDAILSGRTYRYGVERNPGKNGYGIDCTQPGFLGVQMLCYYDPKALLLQACEDGYGEVKRLHGAYNGTAKSLDLNWTWYGWSEKEVLLPYDFITAAVEAKDGDEPLTWHDGADLYRKWAEKQRFCRTPWKFRTDIPKWLRGMCAYADMGGKWRSWMDDKGALVNWAEKYWNVNYPGASVVMHFDGWEKDGVYVMTDYFPLYPDNATFAATMKNLLGHGVLPFPWPSGYRRADAFRKLPDGSFETDERAAFNARFLPMSCKNPDGSRAVENLPVLRGGTSSYMCGGDPRTIPWFSREICGKLADSGVPAVSCDQNIGGAFPVCWDRSHPHTPGYGRWMTDVIRRNSAEALAELRARHPGLASFCYEEPNEQINDTVTFNNTREAYQAKREWSGIFTYLYHEYAPSYPLGGKTTYARAYLAANGVMPRIDIARSDTEIGEPLFGNGGFEADTADGRGVAHWECDYRNAPNAVTEAQHRSGRCSLRVERPKGTNAWRHVARNLLASDGSFSPGRKCRLSAWIKVERGSVSADLGFFGEGRSLGRGRVFADAAKEKSGEWKFCQSDFICPTGNLAMVRLMINARPGSLGWIDDIALEEIMPDGSTRPLPYRGDANKTVWQKRWVSLYGGEGREWMAYGRRVKPPVLDCAKILHGGRMQPAVHVGAFRSQSGELAWVLANGTEVEQRAGWTHKGKRYSLVLPPRGLELKRE